MKTAMIGLLAIPLLIALIAFPTGTQACGGGSYGGRDVIYMNENMTVGAHNYTARVFVINGSAHHVTVRGEEGARIYILSDDEMGNFTAGKEFHPIYNSSAGDRYVRESLRTGKYWTVVDNRDMDTPITRTIDIREEGPMYSQEKCVDPPFFIPDVSSGFVALAMVSAMALTVILKRR